MNAHGSVADTSISEQTLVTGIFGTVTNKRVIYNRSRGWLSGGSREDIALAHVTSVRIDTTRPSGRSRPLTWLEPVVGRHYSRLLTNSSMLSRINSGVS
jgi:hypothetical protein